MAQLHTLVHAPGSTPDTAQQQEQQLQGLVPRMHKLNAQVAAVVSQVGV